ncbi:hypothetical protein GCK72_008915 [Caenorhabditis remanei]|uniref:Uncharacterized protein n=1 Tax=Caenorhabditis remanei TaxID=31234 RepID=A0A6A5H1J1_CAERE|nr:hypothetical protein GCK72_008915 [Caenorhabditis remanei]KAF1760666.1 hypothetical protein GCK72_008915 [Caenorhabditis remanei]
MDPQPYCYEYKKPIYRSTLFPELLSIAGQSGDVSKRKQRLKAFLEKMQEYEPEMELYELHEMENNFVVSRERYKKESARLQLKMVTMMLVIALVGNLLYENVSNDYKTYVHSDEIIIPDSMILLIMTASVVKVYSKMMYPVAVGMPFFMVLLFMIQNKLMDLHEDFKRMITRKKTKEYPNDILNQKFKIIDLLLEDDPPIWNHREVLDQLNWKYLLLGLIPLLMVLVIPVTVHIVISFRFITTMDSQEFLALIASFVTISLILICFPFFYYCDSLSLRIYRVVEMVGHTATVGVGDSCDGRVYDRFCFRLKMRPKRSQPKSKKLKDRTRFFTRPVIVQPGTVTERKQGLQQSVETMRENNGSIEKNFIFTREHYEEEAARLKMKIALSILVMIMVCFCNALIFRVFNTIEIPPDNWLPETPILALMIPAVLLVQLFGVILAFVVKVRYLDAIYRIPKKIMALYEKLKICKPKTVTTGSNEILSQQFKIIDITFEDNPPIRKHDVALKKLKTKYFNSIIIIQMLILLLPFFAQTVFISRFILYRDVDELAALGMSFMIVPFIIGVFGMSFDLETFSDDF